MLVSVREYCEPINGLTTEKSSININDNTLHNLQNDFIASHRAVILALLAKTDYNRSHTSSVLSENSKVCEPRRLHIDLPRIQAMTT